MKHCLYRALYCIFITLILAAVMSFAFINIYKVTNENGLQIIEILDNGVILDGGSMRLQLDMSTTAGLEVGMYIPSNELVQPYINQVVVTNVIVAVIVLIAYVLDILDLRGYILQLKAKKGIELDAEVVGYTKILPLLYTVDVDARGTKFHSRYPLYKFEFKYYPVGKHVKVWNGGVKHIWVDLDAKK